MNKSKLSLALLAALYAQYPSYTSAAETDEDTPKTAREKAAAREREQRAADENVIVIGGMRSSEVAAINMKKFADTISTALSAEEIGALPEQSIAESLEKLTGVTGNQDKGRSNTVSVRGMGGAYTLTTINGREVVSSFGSRSVNLSLYPSAAIRKAQVYKTAMADSLEGGISGTVNMETFKPLSTDKNLRSFSATIDGNQLYHDLTTGDKYGKKLDGFFSQHVSDTFAISAGASYRNSVRYIESIKNAPVLQNLGWTTDWDGDGDRDEIANPASTLNSKLFDIDQTSIFAAAQWELTEDVLISFDYMGSDYNYTMNGLAFSHWGLTSGAQLVDPALADIDPNTGYVMSGIASVTNIGKWDANVLNDDATDVAGLNFNISLSEDLQLEVDLSRSTSERMYSWRSGGGKYAEGINHYLAFDHHGNEYGFEYLGSDLGGNAFDAGTYTLDQSQLTSVINDPSLYNFEKISNTRSWTTSEVDALKMDLTYDTDIGLFHQFKLGARYSENSKKYVTDEEKYEASTLTAEEFAAIIGDNDFSVLNTTLTNNPYQLLNNIKGFDEVFYFNVGDILRDKADILPERVIDIQDQFNAYDLTETTFAAYVQGRFAGDWFDGIIGVRYYETELESTSLVSDYTIEQVGETEFELFLGNDPALVTNTNKYSDILPTLNVNLRFIDDVVIRIGAGKAMIRPTIAELGSNINFNNNADGQNFDTRNTERLESRVLGKAGNPYLNPITSTQADISFEWYPSRWDYVAVATFYKELDGIYEQGATYIPVAGMQDSSGNPLVLPLLSQVKVDAGTVKGWEFSFRQNLGQYFDLLEGVALSGNYMDFSSGAVQDYNPRNEGQNPLDRPHELYWTPVGWIDSTYNFAVTYDHGKKFSARLNLNQQSEMARRDGNDYSVQLPHKNLSLSLKYKISKSFTLFAQAGNLLNEATTSGNLSSDKVGVAHPNFIFEQSHRGISYYFGVRGNF